MQPDQTATIATGQDVLNLAAHRYLQTTDASNPDDLNRFVRYLEHERKAGIVDVQLGSLIITVECSSSQILKELWNDYCTGYVNKMADTYLATKDILNELGIKEVKVTTTIPRKEYEACRKQLQDFDSGECNYFYKYVVSLYIRASLAEVKRPGESGEVYPSLQNFLPAISVRFDFSVVISGVFA